MTVAENLELILKFIFYDVTALFLYYIYGIIYLLFSAPDDRFSQTIKEIHNQNLNLFFYHFLGSILIAIVINLHLNQIVSYVNVYVFVVWVFVLFGIISFFVAEQVLNFELAQEKDLKKWLLFLHTFLFAFTYFLAYSFMRMTVKDIKNFVKKILGLISITEERKDD